MQNKTLCQTTRTHAAKVVIFLFSSVNADLNQPPAFSFDLLDGIRVPLGFQRHCNSNVECPSALMMSSKQCAHTIVLLRAANHAKCANHALRQLA